MWCGTIDGVIKIYDPKTFKCKRELKSDAEAVGCMLKRGNRVWTGTDRDIIIWNSTVTALGSHVRRINHRKLFADILERSTRCAVWDLTKFGRVPVTRAFVVGTRKLTSV